MLMQSKKISKNVGDLRKLFGYKQSIKDFSRIAIPLYDLLKEPKEIKTNTRRSSSKTSIGQHSSKDFIVWTPHHWNILSILIHKMKSPEVMLYTDFNKPF